MVMKFKNHIIVIIINLVIALGFFISNLNVNYSDLSSDLLNIIPVAQKFDNPELFKNDLYLNDINNVRYYTPFYVQSLRFIAKFTNHNYLQALNVMSLICHFLFGVFWFFLIYRSISNFWIALLVSILIRGIVWLPGLELWGISSLWSMMPRTLYIVFLPLPFLILSTSFFRLMLSALLLGLIFNFHPITGLGGILLFLVLVILVGIYYKQEFKFNFKIFAYILIALVFGMLPFLSTYFAKTSALINYDINVFNEIFKLRIPEYFSNPSLFLKQWLHIKTLFYVIPILGYHIISRSNRVQRKQSQVIILLTLSLIILPSISVYVEQFINSIFNVNFRMSFQLIRMQKVAVIPSFFAIAFLLKIVHERYNKYVLPSLFVGFTIIIFVCKHNVFKSVPFMGDDILRHILPNKLSVGQVLPNTKLNVDKMASYIKVNTEQNALIYGSHVFRAASNRSVILDSKGGSMLIEGNPNRFILWRQQQQLLADAKTNDEKIKVLYDLDIDYVVSRIQNFNLEIVHRQGDLILYRL